MHLVGERWGGSATTATSRGSIRRRRRRRRQCVEPAKGSSKQTVTVDRRFENPSLGMCLYRAASQPPEFYPTRVPFAAINDGWMENLWPMQKYYFPFRFVELTNREKLRLDWCSSWFCAIADGLHRTFALFMLIEKYKRNYLDFRIFQRQSIFIYFKWIFIHIDKWRESYQIYQIFICYFNQKQLEVYKSSNAHNYID